jgi:YesN/AraC family two-component response regulator
MEKMISGRKLQSIFRGLSILFQDCEEELLRCDTVAAALELWKAKICVSDEEQKVYGKGYSKITCEVIGYLKNHYHIQNLDINQIADYVSMSTSRLRTVFKEEVGQTLGQYLTDLRMNRAKHLLLETNWKSDQIAEEVGYLDGKYFRKMFKQKYGITPREYREKNWT